MAVTEIVGVSVDVMVDKGRREAQFLTMFNPVLFRTYLGYLPDPILSDSSFNPRCTFILLRYMFRFSRHASILDHFRHLSFFSDMNLS